MKRLRATGRKNVAVKPATYDDQKVMGGMAITDQTLRFVQTLPPPLSFGYVIMQ